MSPEKLAICNKAFVGASSTEPIPSEAQHLGTGSVDAKKADTHDNCSNDACKKAFVRLARTCDQHPVVWTLWKWFLVGAARLAEHYKHPQRREKPLDNGGRRETRRDLQDLMSACFLLFLVLALLVWSVSMLIWLYTNTERCPCDRLSTVEVLTLMGTCIGAVYVVLPKLHSEV